VFNEIDEALRALVRDEVLNSADVDVVFDAPTKDWSSRRNAPTVNLYLYDIREDLRRRERGLVNHYDERGMVVSRHQPPRHFKVSYLITAWTQRPEDEHRLLSALLYCFLRNEALPPELLGGRLAELGLPVTLSVALPPPEDRAFADVWSALGGELKPSLDLVVTAPAEGGRPLGAGPPVQEPLTIDFGDRAGERRDPPRHKIDHLAAASSEAAASESSTTGGSERPGGMKRTSRAKRSPRGREPVQRKLGDSDG
jgi:Pvc16 N-terminal domain